MKKYFILLCTILYSTILFSQRSFSLGDDKKFTDSIEKIVTNSKLDSVKSIHSFRLSKLFKMVGDIKKAHFYLDLGNKLGQKNSFLKDISTYYNTLLLLEKGDMDSYEKSLLKANKDLGKYNNEEANKLRAVILQNYGLVLQSKNKENEAMRMLISNAIPIALKSQNEEVVCHIYKAIGVILMNTEEREKANYYLEKAVYYIESEKSRSPTLEETKYETYILYAENLIELKNYKEARKTIDKAYLLLNKYPNSQFNNTYCFVDGLYYSKLNQHSKAIEQFDKGIKICEFFKDTLSLNRLKFAKYESLLVLKKYREAILIIESLVNNDTFLDNKKNHYKALSESYSGIGNWQKAYSYSEKYITLNDSLNNSKYKNEIIALEAKFNKTENERKIIQLTALKEKSELQAKNNRLNSWILGLIAGFLLLLTGFLFKFYQNQKKLTVQKEINFNQQIHSLKDQQKLAVSNALLEGEEVERKRLARDLHDGLGSMLSGLKFQLSKLSNNSTELKEVDNQLNNSIKELRQIAQNMMPESLLKLGLNAALEDLCLRYSSSVIFIEFYSLGIQDSISESQQIAIYRIVQELINNAIKHSNASNILVSCTQNESRFYITVEDNGKGFDIKKATSTISMGLKNIKNRVEFLNGKLEIDSEPENGTSFNIELNVA
jgi:two-component system, NarL family, sensor kinase